MYMCDFMSQFYQLSDEECLNLAEKGDVKLQYEYARRVLKKQDIYPETAIFWLKKAANQNYIPAIKLLAFCCETGTGVDQNKESYEYWYGKIDEAYLAKAEQGDADAQLEVGNKYFHGGNIIAKDLNQVFKWWFMAAENGNVEAQVRVADSYMYGRFNDADVEQALFWYEKAAENDNNYAQYQLGKYYMTRTVKPGLYIECDSNYEPQCSDFALAVQWFRKAAEEGETNAQFELGKCYYHGIGVPESEEEAYQWFDRARKDGHNEAHFFYYKIVSDSYEAEYEKEEQQRLKQVQNTE